MYRILMDKNSAMHLAKYFLTACKTRAVALCNATEDSEEVDTTNFITCYDYKKIRQKDGSFKHLDVAIKFAEACEYGALSSKRLLNDKTETKIRIMEVK